MSFGHEHPNKRLPLPKGGGGGGGGGREGVWRCLGYLSPDDWT